MEPISDTDSNLPAVQKTFAELRLPSRSSKAERIQALTNGLTRLKDLCQESTVVAGSVTSIWDSQGPPLISESLELIRAGFDDQSALFELCCRLLGWIAQMHSFDTVQHQIMGAHGNTVLRFTLLLLFDPRTDPALDTPTTVDDCLHIFYAAYTSGETDRIVIDQVARNILTSHGTSSVAERCSRLCENDGITQIYGLTSLIILYQRIGNEAMRMALFDTGLPLAANRTYFRRLQRRDNQNVSIASNIMICILLSLSVNVGDKRGLPPKVLSMTSQMMRSEDLLLLIGHVLIVNDQDCTMFAMEDTYMAKNISLMGEIMAEACARDTKFVQQHIKPTWTHVMEAIMTQAQSYLPSNPHWTGVNPDADVLIKTWKDLGLHFGIDESEIRAEFAAIRKEQLGGRVGCSWVRCALYQVDVQTSLASELEICSRCRQVQYCSMRCQKMDWKVGGHRSKCSRK